MHPKGSPTSQVWVIVESPYPADKEKGFVFSGGLGYMFDKMMREAGMPDYYVKARRPELDNPNSFSIIENDLNHYKPPIIIPLEVAGKHFCTELGKKISKKTDSETASDIQKYCGSLLNSPLLNYPHYVIPTFLPSTIVQDWSQRDVAISCDLGKACSELDYFRTHGKLQPMPLRELKYEMDFDETLDLLENRFTQSCLLSVDIETIYTRKKNTFYPHPGYPVTIGIADSPSFGVSFNLFWPERAKTIALWKSLAKLLYEIPQLGQNYFNFDTNFLEALGFRIEMEQCKDTLIRHHVLWPELPHKLQFQTRQYTREPYYKDEGKQWSGKDMRSLRRYNCLDVVVTYEIYLEQEKEFEERPWLR
jgi:hypothetical protein